MVWKRTESFDGAAVRHDYEKERPGQPLRSLLATEAVKELKIDYFRC